MATTIMLDTIQLTNRIEAQIDWIDRLSWQPIGQTIRYALQGNPVIIENPRSGRPITLSAEVPWCWLTSTTVESLYVLASQLNYTFMLQWKDGSRYNVRFRRDQGPLNFTPINPLRTEYTGTIHLIEV